MTSTTSIDALTLVLRATFTNANLIDFANKTTKNIDILASICYNPTQFMTYTNNVKHKYDNLTAALLDLQEDSILIYFADLELYGLFTPGEYEQFCAGVERDTVSTMLKDQIIIFEGAQKLIFISKNPSMRPTIYDYVVKSFTETKKQEILNGTDEIIAVYKCLFARANEIKDTIYLNMTRPVLSVEQCLLAHKCQEDHKVLSVKIIGDVPISYPLPAAAPPVITANGAGAVVNYTEAPTVDERIKYANEWILSHEPLANERATSYYSRYVKSTNTKLPMITFDGVVRSVGYKSLKVNNVSYWKC